IQSDEARLHVFQFVFLARPQIFSLHGLIQPAGEHVIHTTAGSVRVKRRMFSLQELANERMRYRPGFRLRECFELPVCEVPRVRRNEKKKLAFSPRVAQELKSFELKLGHAHTDRTSRTRPVSLRARRMRLVSFARA